MLTGGTDFARMTGLDPTRMRTFTQSLGRQILNQPDLACSLESACTSSIACDGVGSQTAYGLGTANKVLPLSWCALAYSAFKNLNRQLYAQYSQLEDAFESLSLDTFSLGDYFPNGKPLDFSFNSLLGLGGIFAIFGGFIPSINYSVSPAQANRSAPGLVAAAVNSLFTSGVGSTADVFRARKSLSQQVSVISNQLFQSMNEAVDVLLRGDMIGRAENQFNISDMMNDGIWFSSAALYNVTDLPSALRTEILSRKIDSIWKTFSSNKMWILYVDLGDDDGRSRYNADISGPQYSKYCADGGVYCAYNFVKNPEEGGGVSCP